MNEQINELIVSLEPDAFMTYKGYLYHSGDPKVSEHSDPAPLYTRAELVKFAELIVRECAQAADDWYTNPAHKEINWHVDTHLKKHFGVE